MFVYVPLSFIENISKSAGTSTTENNCVALLYEMIVFGESEDEDDPGESPRTYRDII